MMENLSEKTVDDEVGTGFTGGLKGSPGLGTYGLVGLLWGYIGFMERKKKQLFSGVGSRKMIPILEKQMEKIN